MAALGRALVAVAAARCAVSVVVLALGFRAVSDDDYARTVIAQRFAESPAWDPSGTSWLPLPFWIHGGVMSLFGTSLGVARATAIALGVAAALVLYAAGRWIAADPRGALAGALLACLIPYFARLGVATVPEAFTAALIVIGAAAAIRPDATARWLGAAALGLACLSRYEAWPVAAGFAAICAWDALRSRRRELLGPAALAVVAPIAWLVHGQLHHGDPWFFVARVAAYKRALGAGVSSTLEALLAYPVAAFRYEPEIMALGLLALVLGGRSGVPYARSWLALAPLLVFLAAGAVRDGAPTHHAERTLLPLWLLAALTAGAVLTRRRSEAPRALRHRIAGAALCVCLLGGLARALLGRPEPFADRAAEVEMGERARSLLPPGARLGVATRDYGFFAVIAAFGAPGRAAVLDDRDPRRAAAPDAFTSPSALEQRLNALGTRWLVAPAAHRPMLEQLGGIRAHNAELVLVRLGGE